MRWPLSTRILCVEDDIDTCELLKVALPTHKLRLAYTVEQGIKAIDESFFDLYLIDNWLPDGTGLDVCRHLRRSDSNVPVLFLSAAARNTDRKEAMAAGATAYVTKPVDVFHLEDLIESLIEQAELRSIAAKHDEVAAAIAHLREEQRERAKSIDVKIQHATDLIRSARERSARIAAYLKFEASGGTKAYFERAWPEVWDQAESDCGKWDPPS